MSIDPKLPNALFQWPKERGFFPSICAPHMPPAILDRARAHRPGFEDIAIAATAEVHGLTILTDSERHFAPLGVPMLNPLKTLPPLRQSAAP
ncbi:hypothetical protein [Mesorhizobium sp.]|uniref:hypothetical protein n=1 Tax=Mesorhizobium sp. TaxID=1871066 RepID=UPI00338EA521